MNYNALIEYVTNTPLIWLIITFSAFKVGMIIYKRMNQHTLLQPIIIAYTIIMILLFATNTSYEEYFQGVELIHFFLGPATVALALPLYNNLKHIKQLLFQIIFMLVIAGSFSIIIASTLLWLLDAQAETVLSMMTKSITAPIAISTSEQLGGIPSLAIGFVLITGILGALFGTIVFKFLNIKHDTSKGFALGLISHAIGTARALEISQKAAAFSILAMGLNGIFFSIVLPQLIILMFF